MSAGWKVVFWGAAIFAACVVLWQRRKVHDEFFFIALWAALFTIPFFVDAVEVADF